MNLSLVLVVQLCILSLISVSFCLMIDELEKQHISHLVYVKITRINAKKLLHRDLVCGLGLNKVTTIIVLGFIC